MSEYNGSKGSSRRNSQRSKVTKTPSKQSTSSKSAEEEITDESEVKYSFLSKYPEVKPTLSEYKKQTLAEKPLFPTVVTLDSNDELLEKNVDSSFLVTGFGIRNLSSLQDALQENERKRLIELYRQQQKQLDEERLLAEAQRQSSLSYTSRSSSEKSQEATKRSTETASTLTTNVSEQRMHLEYLMGLQTFEEEEETLDAKVEEKPDKDDFVYSKSAPMRNAQKYLRVHRIFDFFQFIIAHLLAKCPENPIDFILELLNKCLLYRSGMGEPPLLYDKKHISQLFCLMDRMGTGFVDLEQYKKGMATLGICEYNKYPISTEDGMDLIGRKWTETKIKKSSEVVYQDDVYRDDSVPYFLPPELFKSYKKEKEKLNEIKEEDEEYYGE
ncbi:uncharacterized protein isoform X2 [Leptinotarsa decemlineata]|uniref:uncharacterized protein isoform X2 n=1 Tax=Leptinotarsa decemlineata TaxID=7539 RepID=UPI000C251EF3|nr:uncharacterized protein LOC111508972 isoform X2 [Leptinotarsa decemlineata]